MKNWRPLSDDPADDANNVGRWRHLPPPLTPALRNPEHYIAHPALIEAINTAIVLGQPLLVTGEPGCGKTELGNYIAHKLGLPKALRYDTKSTTEAGDLFYTFDTLRRFRDARAAESEVKPLDYVRLNAFGVAITLASEKNPHRDRLLASVPEAETAHRSNDECRRSVVLIDEIDKAPRDVPNDLLAEIERLWFTIHEAGIKVVADPQLQPVVVLTSNSEKALPDAFLRRCVYYHMPFPDRERLKRIVELRLRDAYGEPPAASLTNDALDLITHLRDARSLRKRPGTAELLSFLLALRHAGAGQFRRVRDCPLWIDLAKVTLLKAREDQENAKEHFRDLGWSAANG